MKLFNKKTTRYVFLISKAMEKDASKQNIDEKL